MVAVEPANELEPLTGLLHFDKEDRWIVAPLYGDVAALRVGDFEAVRSDVILRLQKILLGKEMRKLD